MSGLNDWLPAESEPHIFAESNLRRNEEVNRPTDSKAKGAEAMKDDLAKKILKAIKKEIHGRKGLGWDGLDEEIQQEIDEALFKKIENEVKAYNARLYAFTHN